MCGGGGGDGGAEAARRSEAENLASIEEARRTLASLYGAGYDYNALEDGVYTGDELGYYGLDPSGEFVGVSGDKTPYWGQEVMTEPQREDYVIKGRRYGGIKYRDEDYEKDLAAYQGWLNSPEYAEYDPSLTYAGYESDYGDLSYQYDPEYASTGYKNFLEREARYGDMRQSILDELITNPTSGMDELRAKAYRDIRSDMIRRGMVGGSADIQSRAGVNTRYGEGISDINQRADSAVTGARGEDYDRYLRAIRAVEGTGDAQSGLDVMQGDQNLYVNQWENEALAKDYSNWFRDLMDMYNLSEYRTGQQSAIDQYGNAFSPGAAQPGKSGRIY